MHRRILLLYDTVLDDDMVEGQDDTVQGAEEHGKVLDAREGDMEQREHDEHDFAFSMNDILKSIKQNYLNWG